MPKPEGKTAKDVTNKEIKIIVERRKNGVSWEDIKEELGIGGTISTFVLRLRPIVKIAAPDLVNTPRRKSKLTKDERKAIKAGNYAAGGNLKVSNKALQLIYDNDSPSEKIMKTLQDKSIIITRNSEGRVIRPIRYGVKNVKSVHFNKKNKNARLIHFLDEEDRDRFVVLRNITAIK